MRLLFALRGDGYLAFTADIKRPFCCRDVTETEMRHPPRMDQDTKTFHLHRGILFASAMDRMIPL